jgi:nitrite reductase (NADH) small subunit
MQDNNGTSEKLITWEKTIKASDVPENDGVAIILDGKQIAVFNFTVEGKWFAVQNLCPHKNEMALSRGLLGDVNGEPKIACPFHKKTFSLETGNCLNDDLCSVDVYPIKIEEGYVFIGIEK